MMAIGWIAKCNSCRREGPYNPRKSGKPPVNHIVDGRMCGAFVNFPTLLPQLKAPRSISEETAPSETLTAGDEFIDITAPNTVV
jgi:hypothetical protein